MRALANWIVANPYQAVLAIVLSTLLSFLAPPLTSILSYVGAAALALYSLDRGGRAGALVMLLSVVATGVLGELLLHQGTAIGVTSLMIWFPVWIAAWVLASTRSLAMATLVLSGLAMLGVLLAFLLYGDPASWWLARMQDMIATLAAQAGPDVDLDVLEEFAGQLAPVMTGSLAAGLAFAAFSCLVLGRWWQSLLLKPGALKQEFYALRLNRSLSLLGVAIVIVAALGFGVVSVLARQWALIVMVPFMFVGVAVIHATLANLKAGRGWLIAIYVLMSLLPQVLLMVAVTGLLDPWLELRQRTARADKTN